PGGRRDGRQSRLSVGFDALLPRVALPARLQRLPDGLRLGDGDRAPARRVRGDSRHSPQRPQMGALRGRVRGGMSTVSAAPPLVRRKPPRSIRRRRFLIAVAEHSLLIAAAIAFLAPFVFITLTALMTNNQALSSSLWPHPFAWHNF